MPRGQGTQPPWAVPAQRRAGHAVPPVGVAGHRGEGLPAGDGHVWLWALLFFELHLSTPRIMWG